MYCRLTFAHPVSSSNTKIGSSCVVADFSFHLRAGSSSDGPAASVDPDDLDAMWYAPKATAATAAASAAELPDAPGGSGTSPDTPTTSLAGGIGAADNSRPKPAVPAATLPSEQVNTVATRLQSFEQGMIVVFLFAAELVMRCCGILDFSITVIAYRSTHKACDSPSIEAA